MSNPIPNTNAAGYTFLSLGDGTDAGYWGTGSGGPPSGTAGGDLSGTYPNPVVANIQTHPVVSTAPTDAQIYVWNSTSGEFVPVNISGDAYMTHAGALTVARIQGNQVSTNIPTTSLNIFMWNGSNWIPTAMSGDGTMSDTGVFALATSGVSAGSYGSGSLIPVITVDAKGRITSASTTAVSGGSPTGTAGGDLSGTYPNPTVAKIQGSAVSSTAPSSTLNVLMWNGTNWIPTALSGDVTATDTGVTNVAKLQGITLTAPTPALNEVLQYNGSAWVPVGLTAPSIAGGFNSTNVGPVSVSGSSPTSLTTVSASGFLEYLVIVSCSMTASVANTGQLGIYVGGLLQGIGGIASFTASAYASCFASFPYSAGSTGTVTFEAGGTLPGSGTVSYYNISLTILGVNPTVAVH